jgi:hypothetical protein
LVFLSLKTNPLSDVAENPSSVTSPLRVAFFNVTSEAIFVITVGGFSLTMILSSFLQLKINSRLKRRKVDVLIVMMVSV